MSSGQATVIPFEKRVFDVVLAGTGLVVSAPLFFLISGALWVESPGHVFFAQRRLGQGGKPFLLYKFRKFPHTWGDTGPGVTVAGDVRMTGLGRFLERSKLDELPQLWNILKGDMSVVGPRPESCRYADLFQGEFSEVLKFRPGIFGPNQVAYRNESGMYPDDVDPENFYAEVLFPAKAQNDLGYFRRATIHEDFWWMVRSLYATFGGMISIPLWLGNSSYRLLGDAVVALCSVALIQFSLSPKIMLAPVMFVLSLLALGCYRYPTHRVAFRDAMLLGGACVMFSVGFGVLCSLGLLQIINLALVAFSLALIPRGVSRKWNTGRCRGPKIVIYGAKAVGRALSVFIEFSQEYELVGFVDEDRSIRDTRLGSATVLGLPKDLRLLVVRHQVNQIWLTEELSDVAQRELEQLAQEHAVFIHQPLQV